MGGESIKPIRKRIHVYFLMTAYRQKNKGKKPHYYALSKKAKEALHILALKRNLKEEEVIENLINEFYVKECVDALGETLY